MDGGHTTALGKWLQRLEAGCPEAQAAIIEHTCERLRYTAKGMLRMSPKVRRWAETDDLLQDALVRLHRSLAQVKPTTAREFYGLAATQLRRQLIDLARKHYGPNGVGTRHQLCENEHVETMKPKPPESLDDWTEFVAVYSVTEPPSGPPLSLQSTDTEVWHAASSNYVRKVISKGDTVRLRPKYRKPSEDS